MPDFADPLELSARSRLGVPGLVQAVRDGTVTIANALGSGLVESRAMLSFLPALGAGLARPRAGAAEYRHVVARRSRSAQISHRTFRRIGDRLGLCRRAAGPYPKRCHARQGARRHAHATALIESILRRGVDFVAQEAVTLSTTPVWDDGRLLPRPFIMRLLLARVGGGWQVMPGGFVRIADSGRCTRGQPAARRRGRPMPGCCPTGRWRKSTLLPTPERHRHQSHDRPTAEPRRRQSVLARPLYGARRGESAAGSRPDQSRHRDRRRACARSIACIRALLVAWNAVPDDMLNVKPALVASAGSAAARPRRRFAAARRRRAGRGFRHPRPLFARCLARAQ